MLWTPLKRFHSWPFEKEADLESAISELQTDLFGKSRVYLNVKKLIGQPGKTQNIPDGYLLDLSSRSKPLLYLVEVELAEHDRKHIAHQLLNFSLSFKSTRQKMKEILRNALKKNQAAFDKCEQYALENGYNNIDYLLEKMIHHDDAFRALVIIDKLDDDLEEMLNNSLRSRVEKLVVARFRSASEEVIYQFDPFLYDLSSQSTAGITDSSNTSAIDPSDIDTIIVPAQEDGFREVFLGQDMWHHIRIHSSMISNIRYIAAYQSAPVSAITYVAEVERIETWNETQKYVLYFKGHARKITPIPRGPGGRGSWPQSTRYTSYARLQKAKTLDDLW
jgi:hypothetical protein